MPDARTTERYRGHDLIFMETQGAWKGKAWVVGSPPIEARAPTVQAVRSELQARIDEALECKDPVKECVRALRALLKEGRPPSDWAMIKAHYRAPNKSITASELADAVGFPNYNTINMRYGLLGQALYDTALLKLPDGAKDAKGKPIYTFVIADGERMEGDDWRWTMRPEMAAAMEELGLQN